MHRVQDHPSASSLGQPTLPYLTGPNLAQFSCADDGDTRKHTCVNKAVRRIDVPIQVAVLDRHHIEPWH